jgi:hypothetical protein
LKGLRHPRLIYLLIRKKFPPGSRNEPPAGANCSQVHYPTESAMAMNRIQFQSGMSREKIGTYHISSPRHRQRLPSVVTRLLRRHAETTLCFPIREDRSAVPALGS